MPEGWCNITPFPEIAGFHIHFMHSMDISRNCGIWPNRPCSGKSVARLHRRLSWLSNSLLAVAAAKCAVSLAATAEHPSLAAFRLQLSNVPPAFEIEFDEGDVHNPPHHETTLDDKGRPFIFKPSVSSFVATCQLDGFMIRRAPDEIPSTPAVPKSLKLEYGFRGGYNSQRAWWAEQAVIQLFELTEETRRDSKSILGQIRRYERRAWRVYFLGLPRIDSSSLMWEGLTLKAVTTDGSRLEAQCHLRADGALEKVTYKTDGATAQEGTITYEYDSESKVHPLPAVFTCSVRQASNPLEAAMNSVTVRLRRLTPQENSFLGERFIPSGEEINTNHVVLHSNDVIFAKSGQKFIQIDPENIRRTIRHNEGRSKRTVFQIGVFAVLLALGIGMAATLRRTKDTSTNQNKQRTTYD